jgi:thiosulfate/3-mercaptopyruvate sulfurtransferase
MANANDVDLRRGDLGWRVIDARSAERFRGDVEPIDPVAGCIEGAVNLPWADCVDGGFLRPRSELEALVEGVLGDVPADRVITHCGSGVTACHTLFVLELLGRGQGSLYVGSWSEWCRR